VALARERGHMLKAFGTQVCVPNAEFALPLVYWFYLLFTVLAIKIFSKCTSCCCLLGCLCWMWLFCSLCRPL